MNLLFSIRLCSYYVFSINQKSDNWSRLKLLAIKRWFPFNFANVLLGCHFLVGGPKDLKLLPDISFDSGFQKIVLSSLLLFFVLVIKLI